MTTLDTAIQAHAAVRAEIDALGGPLSGNRYVAVLGAELRRLEAFIARLSAEAA